MTAPSRRALAVLLALVATSGACVFGPCDPERRTFDLIFGGAFYEIARDQLARARADGWDCGDSETILNARGAPAGIRYRCRKCS
jgi:hypothetical protein